MQPRDHTQPHTSSTATVFVFSQFVVGGCECVVRRCVSLLLVVVGLLSKVCFAEVLYVVVVWVRSKGFCFSIASVSITLFVLCIQPFLGGDGWV